METHNEDPERLARYLNQLVFCLYSEDAGVLPEGLFTRIVAQPLPGASNLRRGDTQPVQINGDWWACRG